MTPYDYVLLCFEIIFMLVGIIGNGLVLVVHIQRSIRKSEAVILNLFLACGNFLYNLLVKSLQIARRVTDWTGYEASNRIDASAYNICSSFLGILFGIELYVVCLNILIAVTRYRIICGAPGQRMTRRTIYIILFFVVLLSIVVGIVVGVISSADTDTDGNLICRISESTRLPFYFFIFGTVFVSVVAIFVLSVKMIRNVKIRQRRVFPMQPTENGEGKINTVSAQLKPSSTVQQNQAGTSQSPTIKPQHILSQEPIPGGFQSLPPPVTQNPANERFPIRNFQRETLDHMTKSLLATTLTFSIIWFCVFLLTILQGVLANFVMTTPPWLILFSAGILMHLNHIFGPFILWYVNTAFRDGLKKLICRN